jgi:hypothetical protein
MINIKKGVTPEALYMPKVGEEIEYKEDPIIEVYTPAIYCGYVDGDYIVKHHKQSPSILTRFHNKPERMRPLLTERDKLTDVLVNIMINHYGNPKGAEGYKQLAEAILSDEDLSITSVSNQKNNTNKQDVRQQNDI